MMANCEVPKITRLWANANIALHGHPKDDSVWSPIKEKIR